MDALPQLRDGLGHRDPMVVRKAALALCKMPRAQVDAELPHLVAAAARVRLPSAVLERIAQAKDAGVFALAAEVRRSGALRVAELVEHFGPAALPLLPDVVRALEQADAGGFERWHLCAAIGRMGEGARSAVPVLVRQLGSSSEVVRWAALEALHALGADGDAVEGAVRVLQVTHIRREVIAAMRLLQQARCCTAEVVRAMRQHLCSRDREVLETSWTALAALGPEVALGVIRDGLTTQDPLALKSGPLLAARLLGQGARPLRPEILALTQDKTWSHWAKQALRALG